MPQKQKKMPQKRKDRPVIPDVHIDKTVDSLQIPYIRKKIEAGSMEVISEPP